MRRSVRYSAASPSARFEEVSKITSRERARTIAVATTSSQGVAVEEEDDVDGGTYFVVKEVSSRGHAGEGGLLSSDAGRRRLPVSSN
ncbi:hypothetical protein ACSQ67_024442 [Phaseolus vulgaris]